MSTPVKFLELTLQNFMSYGNNVTSIDLNFNEPQLIVGKNYDAVVNGEVDSNGAGKSAILDALAFVLYDKTISNKDKAGLINNINKKNLEVTLTFQKDGFMYKIIRMRKTKTKADVQFLVMDKDGEYRDKTPDSIANTNIEIERVVGIPFDVFARIIVFSATFQPFLDLPSRHSSKASQTSIMEELFGYTELTDKANKLKESIKGGTAEFNHLKELQEQIAREIQRHKTQIDAVKERIDTWEVTHTNKITETEGEIKSLASVDLEGERKKLVTLEASKTALADLTNERLVVDAEIQTLNAQVQTYEAQIKTIQTKKDALAEKRGAIEKVKNKVTLIEDKVDFEKETKLLDDIEELAQENDSLGSKIKDAKRAIKTRSTQMEKIDKEISHLNDSECPYCGQDFEDVKDKLADLDNQRTTLNKDNSTDEEDILEYNSKIESNNVDIEKGNKKSVTKGSLSELIKLEAQYEDYKSQIEAYTEEDIDESVDELDTTIPSQIDEKNDRILELIALMEGEKEIIDAMKEECEFNSLSDIEKVSGKLSAAKERLEAVKVEENPHTDQLKELEDVTFDHDKSDKLNELNDTLEHQAFLLKLLTKKDSFVRKNLLDRSLPFLNKRLMEYLGKLGLPHRVEFKGDMTASISQFGTSLDFGNLSSGQKARVNLALAFAFRDVLQARHGKISFCMLDECLDTGLGNVGVQLAAKMIKEIATEDKMSMLVISHRDEIASMFKNQLVVELRDGFSNIAEEA